MDKYIFNGPAGTKLDSFILAHKPQLSQGLLHKYLRQNKIKVNGKKAPLATPLVKGDMVTLYLPARSAPAPTLPAGWVLFEDDNLLCVNKPAGMPVDENTANPTGTSLAQRAANYVAATTAGAKGDFAPRLCHRLDTGTSGVVLLAKNAATFAFVTGLLKNRQLAKEYIAVTFGQPQPAKGKLGGWLLKNAARGTVYIAQQKAPGAKPVETRYETLAVSGRLALVRVWPKTGRTHQIRAHMANLGTPILGDGKYGNQAINRQLRCRYQCLCALRVRFPAVIEEAAYKRYAGLCIECENPWYCAQVLDGILQ